MSTSSPSAAAAAVGADGGTYVGQYKDGKMHGVGKYTFADGEVAHDGEWEDDLPKK